MMSRRNMTDIHETSIASDPGAYNNLHKGQGPKKEEGFPYSQVQKSK